MPRLKYLRIFYLTGCLIGLGCLVGIHLTSGVQLPDIFLVKLGHLVSWMVLFASCSTLAIVVLFPRHAERRDNALLKSLITAVGAAGATHIYMTYIEPIVLPA
jgi:cyanate permease